MTKTYLALPLIAALMASSAQAQTSDAATSGSGTEGSSGNQTGQNNSEGDTATSAIVAQEGAEAGSLTGRTWSDVTNNTFFADPDMTALRSADEVQTGWNSLSADDQARVREDCATYRGGSGASTTATDTSATATDQTSESGTFATGMDDASMTQICDWVNSF